MSGYRAAIAKADQRLARAEQAASKTSAGLAKANKAVDDLRKHHRQKMIDAVEALKDPPEPLDETKIANRLRAAGDANRMAADMLRQAHDERALVLASFVDEIRADAVAEWRQTVDVISARVGDLTDDVNRLNEKQGLVGQAVRAHNLSAGSRPHWDPERKERIDDKPQRVTVADLAAAGATKARGKR